MIIPDKILLVRPDRLGDLILSLPVAETIKKNMPDSGVYYFASPHTASLAPMTNYVDGWLIDENNVNNQLSIANLAGKIRRGGYDCLIELKPSWRTAVSGLLSGVNFRIGTSRRFYSVFYNRRLSIHRRSSGYHQTDLELKHLDIFHPESYIRKPNLSVTDHGRAGARELFDIEGVPYIVIHPGSGSSSPNWPLEHYQKLVVLIKENLDCAVVITDGKTELPGFHDCVNLGGKTDLETLGAILGNSEAFISGSTGPLHMADALGAPCLSFFVNRPDIGPERWGPRRNLANVITPPTPCGCLDLKKCRCLEQVLPDEAFLKLKNLLTKRKITGVRGN